MEGDDFRMAWATPPEYSKIVVVYKMLSNINKSFSWYNDGSSRVGEYVAHSSQASQRDVLPVSHAQAENEQHFGQCFASFRVPV